MIKTRILFILMAFSLVGNVWGAAFTVNVREKGTLESLLAQAAGDLENVTELTVTGELDDEDFYVFENLTNLEVIDLGGVKCPSCLSSSFASLASLRKVVLPACVQELDFGAFMMCSSLADITMPGVTTLGMYAFFYCTSLTSVVLPATLASVDNSFAGCTALTTITCQGLVPFSGSLFGGLGPDEYTMYVPQTSLQLYLDACSEEGATIVGKTMEASDLTVHGELTLTSLDGLDGVNVDFAPSGIPMALTVDAPGTWNIGRFHMTADSQNDENLMDENWNTLGTYYPNTGSLLNKGTTISAQDISVSVRDNCSGMGEWTFFCLPFDADIKDINPGGDERWVIRRYDGESRAAVKSGETWKNVRSDERLNAYQGYIVMREFDIMQHMDGEYEEPEPFLFKAADTENKQNIFTWGDVTVPLNPYPAEMDHNSGWNLVGNPYPCYYNIGSIEGAWVLMSYNGWAYDIYTTQDDVDHALMPFSAFFVQCPKGVDGITFHQSGRVASKIYEEEKEEEEDEWDYMARTRMAGMADRQLFNILLSDGRLTDRTRLVVNPSASTKYEIQKDAPKMMSERKDVPQIFILDGGMSYAIDERPLGGGTFTLGMQIGQTGRHTISMNTKVRDCSVVLTDHLTGEVTDLATSAYEFEGEKGLTGNRFSINVSNGATCIEHIADAKADETMYDLQGRKLQNAANGQMVIRGGKKVFIRK